MSRPLKIIAAVDLSDYSEVVVHYSVHLCMKLDAELLLINVINQRELVMVQHCMACEVFSFPDYLPEREPDHIKRMQDLFRAASPGMVRCRYMVKNGIPYRELLAVIDDEKPNLMVLSSKGRSNLADVIVGSTARQLYRRSPIPLITIPADFNELPCSKDLATIQRVPGRPTKSSVGAMVHRTMETPMRKMSRRSFNEAGF